MQPTFNLNQVMCSHMSHVHSVDTTAFSSSDKNSSPLIFIWKYR